MTCKNGSAVAAAMQAMRGELTSWSGSTLDDSFVDDCWDEALSKYGPYGVFGEVLSRWAAHDVKPLILLIDEIDSLIGDTLYNLMAASTC